MQNKTIEIENIAFYRGLNCATHLGDKVTAFGSSFVELLEISFRNINIPYEYRFSKNGRNLKSEWRVIFMLTGRAQFETKDLSTTLVKDDVLVVAPNQWHRFLPDKDKPAAIAWMGFSELSKELLSVYTFLKTTAIYPAALSSEIKEVLVEALRVVDVNSTKCDYLVRSSIDYAVSLLNYKVQRFSKVKNSIDDKIAKAREILRGDKRCSFCMEDVAKMIDMDYISFRRHFKYFAGSSPSQYQTMQRLQNACELLTQSELTISEIAKELGFTDTAQFSKFFHKHMHITARDYRKSERFCQAESR